MVVQFQNHNSNGKVTVNGSTEEHLRKTLLLRTRFRRKKPIASMVFIAHMKGVDPLVEDIWSACICFRNMRKKLFFKYASWENFQAKKLLRKKVSHGSILGDHPLS